MEADTTDVVRLIGQHLIGLGYNRTFDALLEESKVGQLDHPVAVKFRNHILNGEWSKADLTLDELSLFLNENSPETLDEMRCLIAEQNFLELIEDGNQLKALKCLRKDIWPKQKDLQKIKRLTTILLCNQKDEFKTKVNWLGKGPKSRQQLMDKLHKYIPLSILLPPKRLGILLEQAVQLQLEKCLLHNSTHDTVDLKSNHLCTPEKAHFPVQTSHMVEHDDEIWYCKFSNDGRKLATCGKRGRLYIWEFDATTKLLETRYVLKCDTSPLGSVSWSPNDEYILACGSEELPDCWFYNSQTKELKSVIKHNSEKSMATCSWHPSGELFAIASTKGNFVIYDIEANEKSSRQDIRVQWISFFNHDHKSILAADILRRIRRYSLDNFEPDNSHCIDEDIIEEHHNIMSFCIDKDDMFIATNLARQGVHLWDYKTRTLLQTFKEVAQRDFTIHGNFSPFDVKFFASGSEGKLYDKFHHDSFYTQTNLHEVDNTKLT